VKLLLPRGQWQEVAADLRQVIELDPADHTEWRQLATLLADTGDVAAYREHCEKMLMHVGETPDRMRAERTARTCLLLPASGHTLDAACRCADLALPQDQGKSFQDYYPTFLFTKGLAEYRRERFADAAQWLHQATDEPSFPQGAKLYAPRDVWAYATLAMARQRLGQPDAARVALAKAEQVFKTELSQLEYSATEWHNRLIAQILLREARNVVGETKAASQPRAP
jgi:serine/threonine-protein kinase